MGATTESDRGMGLDEAVGSTKNIGILEVKNLDMMLQIICMG